MRSLSNSLIIKFFQFSGKAGRLEFNYFLLFTIINFVACYFIYNFYKNTINSNILLSTIGILCLMVFIPFIAVSIRRLNDLGLNSICILIYFAPLIILLISMVILKIWPLIFILTTSLTFQLIVLGLLFIIFFIIFLSFSKGITNPLIDKKLNNSTQLILIQTITEKYFQLSGRANRREYIYFISLYIFLNYLLIIIFNFFPQSIIKLINIKIYNLINFFMFLFSIIPFFTLNIRRFKDINFNGYWVSLILFYIEIYKIYMTISITFFYDNILLFNPQLNFPIFYFYYYLSMIILFILCIIPGTSGPNRFGDEAIY